MLQKNGGVIAHIWPLLFPTVQCFCNASPARLGGCPSSRWYLKRPDMGLSSKICLKYHHLGIYVIPHMWNPTARLEISELFVVLFVDIMNCLVPYELLSTSMMSTGWVSALSWSSKLLSHIYLCFDIPLRKQKSCTWRNWGNNNKHPNSYYLFCSREL